MWSVENRRRYNRDQLRYPSDVTEEEWAEVAPLMPPARRGGRQRSVNIREVFNGLLYVWSTGCQRRAIPKEFPPRGTLFDYFTLWQADGTLGRIHRALSGRCREQAPRAATPTAGLIDSQRVKSAEKGGGGWSPWGLMRANKSRGRNATG
jgi:transposase